MSGSFIRADGTGFVDAAGRRATPSQMAKVRQVMEHRLARQAGRAERLEGGASRVLWKVLPLSQPSERDLREARTAMVAALTAEDVEDEEAILRARSIANGVHYNVSAYFVEEVRWDLAGRSLRCLGKDATGAGCSWKTNADRGPCSHEYAIAAWLHRLAVEAASVAASHKAEA